MEVPSAVPRVEFQAGDAIVAKARRLRRHCVDSQDGAEIIAEPVIVDRWGLEIKVQRACFQSAGGPSGLHHGLAKQLERHPWETWSHPQPSRSSSSDARRSFGRDRAKSRWAPSGLQVGFGWSLGSQEQGGLRLTNTPKYTRGSRSRRHHNRS